jgi:hypothetical protein
MCKHLKEVKSHINAASIELGKSATFARKGNQRKMENHLKKTLKFLCDANSSASQSNNFSVQGTVSLFLQSVKNIISIATQPAEKKPHIENLKLQIMEFAGGKI